MNGNLSSYVLLRSECFTCRFHQAAEAGRELVQKAEIEKTLQRLNVKNNTIGQCVCGAQTNGLACTCDVNVNKLDEELGADTVDAAAAELLKWLKSEQNESLESARAVPFTPLPSVYDAAAEFGRDAAPPRVNSKDHNTLASDKDQPTIPIRARLRPRPGITVVSSTASKTSANDRPTLASVATSHNLNTRQRVAFDIVGMSLLARIESEGCVRRVNVAGLFIFFVFFVYFQNLF